MNRVPAASNILEILKSTCHFDQKVSIENMIQNLKDEMSIVEMHHATKVLNIVETCKLHPMSMGPMRSLYESNKFIKV